MKRTLFAAAIGAALAAPAPATADEIFGGVYAHDVNWVTRSGIEDGVDLQLGWRGRRILPMLGGPSPHLLVSVNSAGDTHFTAAGVSWRIGNSIYVRPGLGLAVHTGPSRFDRTRRRIWFGSRLLFEPELGLGYRMSPRLSVEASWVHLSHAKLFNRQNPGLDTVGLRLNYTFR